MVVRLLERLLRGFARLLLRGPHAAEVVADLDESYERDRARGLGRGRARWRWIGNLLGSAWSLWRSWGGGRSAGLSSLDLKLGWRLLWKHPLVTVVSVVSLAVGIPVGFGPSYAWDALEAPLPVPEGKRVVGLRHVSVDAFSFLPTTIYDLAVWRESLTTFEAVGAYRRVEHNLIVGDEGVGGPVAAAVVTASTFPILRLRPLLGRTLVAADERPGGEPVVVIGEEVWRSRMGADPEAVGRQVRVAGVQHTVVGVMPAAFLFPVREELWLPLRDVPAGEPGVGPRLFGFGRLADGVTEEEAQREVDAIERRVAQAFPSERVSRRAEVLSFPVMATGGTRGGCGPLRTHGRSRRWRSSS